MTLLHCPTYYMDHPLTTKKYKSYFYQAKEIINIEEKKYLTKIQKAAVKEKFFLFFTFQNGEYSRKII